MAEANLGKKETENAALREQVQEFEVRWLEYEGKMKAMEDTWQKQMASLQVSFYASVFLAKSCMLFGVNDTFSFTAVCFFVRVFATC